MKYSYSFGVRNYVFIQYVPKLVWRFSYLIILYVRTKRLNLSYDSFFSPNIYNVTFMKNKKIMTENYFVKNYLERCKTAPLMSPKKLKK